MEPKSPCNIKLQLLIRSMGAFGLRKQRHESVAVVRPRARTVISASEKEEEILRYAANVLGLFESWARGD